MSITAEQLLAQIDSGFSELSRPQSDVAPSQYGDEGLELLQGRDRDSLEDHEVFAAIGNFDLYLLTPKALRYYWPRVVRFALLRGDEVGDNMLLHILTVLGRANESETATQFSMFTAAQRESICLLLRFLREERANTIDDFGVREELDATWSRWACK